MHTLFHFRVAELFWCGLAHLPLHLTPNWTSLSIWGARWVLSAVLQINLESHPSDAVVSCYFFSSHAFKITCSYFHLWKMNGFEPFSTPPWHLVHILVSQTNSSSRSSAFPFLVLFPIVLSVVLITLQLIFSGLGYTSPVTLVRSNCKILHCGLTRYFKPQGSSVKGSLPASNKVRNNFTEMKNFSLLSCKTWVQTKIGIGPQAEVFPQVPQISVKHNLHPNFQLWREASLTLPHFQCYMNCSSIIIFPLHRSRNKRSHVVGCWQETSICTYSWRD